MSSRRAAVCALFAVFALAVPVATQAEPSRPSGTLTLSRALQRAVAANPKLAAADRDIGIAAGKRIQAGAIPNPELSFELDDAFGTGQYRSLDSAETTLAISQLIELGGKRDARVAAGSAELEAARWERAAVRLEILSDTAVAFFNVLGGQRKVQILRRADRLARAADAVAPAASRGRRLVAGRDRARPAGGRSGPRRARARAHRARHRAARAGHPHGLQCRGLRLCRRRPEPDQQSQRHSKPCCAASTAIRS